MTWSRGVTWSRGCTGLLLTRALPCLALRSTTRLTLTLTLTLDPDPDPDPDPDSNPNPNPNLAQHDEMDLLHGDIKSANVCLMGDFSARVIDCGLGEH